jgi:hypothetical protein
MDVSNINSNTLRSLLKLTEKRDALVAEIKKIDSEIVSAYAGKAPAPAKRGARKVAVKTSATPPQRKKGSRGALKAKILAALREAGAKGVAVKDLSKKLGVKNQNVHVWFSSTGKKLGTIQKVSAGNYRLKAGAY